MRVTVIIPCYNVESYINECVESVRRQSHQDVEIICVDNGSTDRTLEKLEELSNEGNITLLREPNKGACYARNAGLANATGDWIQFLDADDLLLDGKLLHQIELLSSVSDKVGFISGASITQNVSGKQVIKKIDDVVHPYLSVFTIQSGNTCSNLWRRSALEKVNGWNTSLQSSQEADLMMRLVINGYQFMIDNLPLTIIRERLEGQISQTAHEFRLQRFVELRLKFIQTIKHELPDKAIINQMYDFIVVALLQYANYNRANAIVLYNSQIRNYWQPMGCYGLSMLKGRLLKTIGLNCFLRII